MQMIFQLFSGFQYVLQLVDQSILDCHWKKIPNNENFAGSSRECFLPVANSSPLGINMDSSGSPTDSSANNLRELLPSRELFCIDRGTYRNVGQF
jgi:hypothetical protein